MMNRNYQIVSVTTQTAAAYAEQFAKLHRQEIDNGFLSSLGRSFLCGMYAALARSPHCFLIAAEKDNKVLGFFCGSTNTKKVYREFLLTGGGTIAIRLLPKLLSWQRVRRTAETWLYPSRSRQLNLPEAEVLNFCVDRNHQRCGIGRTLFAQAVKEFAERNVASIRIVTGADQHSAQQFYESVAAKRHSDIEIHAGSQSVVYTFSVSQQQSRIQPSAA